MRTVSKTRWLTAGLMAGLAVCAFAPCALAKDTITVKGSDTMILLAQRWAETYMKENADVTIQVTGGGSGTGIAALLNGTTTIANASRPISEKEVATARQRGEVPYEIPTAMDALSVVVNKENPVTELSMKQIMGIYIGGINNWKEVGGPDAKILRYARESNSGTYVFFKEHVLKNKSYAADCQTMPGTSALAEAVARDRWGIGYGGVAYFATRPEVRILSVKKDDANPAKAPLKPDGSIDFQSVYDNSYPIARYLYCYTRGEPQGEARKYLEWIVGKEGQQIADKLGYVPLPQ